MMQYVIITFPIDKRERLLQRTLIKYCLQPFYFPTFQVVSLPLHKKMKETLEHIEEFDWILFTSSNGVHFFIEALQSLHISLSKNSSSKIGVVGEKTAETARYYHLPVSFIPENFSAKDVSNELPDILEKTILLPQSKIADATLKRQLMKNGATVVRLPIYTTEYIQQDMTKIQSLTYNRQIHSIMFSSPSSIKGLLFNMEKFVQKDSIFSLPVIVIGNTTAQTARKYFEHVYVAKKNTVDGMLKTIKDIM